MGFSISATTAIIGVAFIMVLELSLGTIIPVLTDVDGSFNDMRQRAIDQIQTDIEINNITIQANASLHDLEIEIKNSGSTVIEKSYTTLLINGSLSSFTCSSDYWFPESEYSLFVYGVSGSGSIKVKIITKNGISDYDTYTV